VRIGEGFRVRSELNRTTFTFDIDLFDTAKIPLQQCKKGGEHQDTARLNVIAQNRQLPWGAALVHLAAKPQRALVELLRPEGMQAHLGALLGPEVNYDDSGRTMFPLTPYAVEQLGDLLLK